MTMGYFRISALWALLLFPAPAFAETIWDVLQRFGWTGTWAASCQDAPSAKNVWTILTRDPDGVVKRKLDRGPDGPPLISVVDSAQVVTPSTMQVRLRNDDANWGAMNGMFFDVVQTIENDALRALQSKGSDGKDYIKDGIVIATGRPSASLHRCPE
jgi:hypothetical protein